MNIGMLLPSYFPPDVRVHREAKVLIENGHKVFLFTKLRYTPTSIYKSSMKRFEKYDGINVVRYPLFEISKIKILDRLSEFILNVPLQSNVPYL